MEDYQLNNLCTELETKYGFDYYPEVIVANVRENILAIASEPDEIEKNYMLIAKVLKFSLNFCEIDFQY